MLWLVAFQSDEKRAVTGASKKFHHLARCSFNEYFFPSFILSCSVVVDGFIPNNTANHLYYRILFSTPVSPRFVASSIFLSRAVGSLSKSHIARVQAIVSKSQYITKTSKQRTNQTTKMPSNNDNNNSSEKMQEQITLSKRMFIAGCFGLPWLWICNVLYFRARVFQPLVFIDYWPGHVPPPRAGQEGDEQEQEQSVDYQLDRMELKKWVKRSTFGAVIVMGAFIAWIITFQTNKEFFGPKWFVVDETEASQSGW